jgi:hypothetical protein
MTLTQIGTTNTVEPDPALDGEKYYTSYIPRLRPDLKEIWLIALESEEYKDKQFTGVLKDARGGGFCCLGVYCEITGVPQISENNRVYAGGDFVPIPTVYFGSKTNPNWSSIPVGYEIPFETTSNASFSGDQTVFVCRNQGPKDWSDRNIETYPTVINKYTLPSLNDTGFTFAQIADIIRYFL